MESQSGIQMSNPRIYGRWEDPDPARREVAYLVIHPANNFMGHYLVEPLRDRNRAILALNTRYLGNDSMLLMERAIQDLGAGVRFLREQGFRKVVLVGNSGGGSLVCFYQQQAEKLTVKATPDGRRIDLHPDDIPPADAIALLCAHPGRARTLACMIDPSVVDEDDPTTIDPELDMFDPRNGPPYDRSWLERYRAAQEARVRRLARRALEGLAAYEADPSVPVTDQALLVHRTMADPRNLDLSIDSNDREPGSIWGDARLINYAPNGTARYSTFRSFLSQWSLDHSQADGPGCLTGTSVPVLNLDYTADQIVFPSGIADYSRAAAGRCTEIKIRNVGHYPQGDPKAVKLIAETLLDWGG